MWLSRSVGVNLHPTSLPGGRLGPEAYAFVDWLAAAGARFWQVLPLNPPDDYGSPYASVSAFASWPGLLADPDAVVEPSEIRRFERAAGVLDRRLGRVRGRRRARRPGAVPARVVGPARVRRRARRAPDRRRADLRRRGQLRPRRAPRALPPRRLRRGRAARSAQRAGAEVGQSALRLGCALARGLPLVDRAPAPDARPLRRVQDRSLPRLRRLLGCADERDGPRGPLVARPRSGRLPRRRARARHAARDRRGSRA